MSAADHLLSRLDGVRRTGDGRWIARCPAHDDSSPSLSVRELDDGRILVHCFTGCATADVVAAVRLSLADLFPGRLPDRRSLRQGERWVPADVLRAIAHEVAVVALAADSVARNEPLSDGERERVLTAAGRIRAAALVGGAYG